MELLNKTQICKTVMNLRLLKIQIVFKIVYSYVYIS